jgi:hypothetical protein
MLLSAPIRLENHLDWTKMAYAIGNILRLICNFSGAIFANGIMHVVGTKRW